MTVTVIVPSFQRPDDLAAGLDALCRGSRVPDQVVVVLRDRDRASHEALAAWRQQAGACAQRVELAEVCEPGQVAATNAGLPLARGEIICFTDDDCQPTATWLERILSHYDDPGVVGVGGRDIVHQGDAIEAEPAPVVGRLTWCGRMTGNHHQPGFDDPREVDYLKGANMSFRREAVLGFDPNLVGAHFSDTDASLSARAHGGKLIYDPLATVDHYPAPRLSGHARASTSAQEVFADAHDWAYVMWKHLSPVGRAGFLPFALLVGQDRRWGLLRMLLALPRGPLAAVRCWWASLRGIVAGIQTCRRASASHSGVALRKPSDGAPGLRSHSRAEGGSH